jgi:hypothetical protein
MQILTPTQLPNHTAIKTVLRESRKNCFVKNHAANPGSSSSSQALLEPESQTVRVRALGFWGSYIVRILGFYWGTVSGGYLIAFITARSRCLLVFQNHRTGESWTVRTADCGVYLGQLWRVSNCVHNRSFRLFTSIPESENR